MSHLSPFEVLGLRIPPLRALKDWQIREICRAFYSSLVGVHHPDHAKYRDIPNKAEINKKFSILHAQLKPALERINTESPINLFREQVPIQAELDRFKEHCQKLEKRIEQLTKQLKPTEALPSKKPIEKRKSPKIPPKKATPPKRQKKRRKR